MCYNLDDLEAAFLFYNVTLAMISVVVITFNALFVSYEFAFSAITIFCLILLSIISFVFAVIGFVTTLYENRFVIYAYAFIMTAIIFGNITLLIMWSSDARQNYIQLYNRTVITQQTEQISKHLYDFMAMISQNNKCCGLMGIWEYPHRKIFSGPYDIYKYDLPDYCYANGKPFRAGCEAFLQYIFDDGEVIIYTLLCSNLLLQAIPVALSYVMIYRSNWDDNDTVWY